MEYLILADIEPNQVVDYTLFDELGRRVNHQVEVMAFVQGAKAGPEGDFAPRKLSGSMQSRVTMIRPDGEVRMIRQTLIAMTAERLSLSDENRQKQWVLLGQGDCLDPVAAILRGKGLEVSRFQTLTLANIDTLLGTDSISVAELILKLHDEQVRRRRRALSVAELANVVMQRLPDLQSKEWRKANFGVNKMDGIFRTIGLRIDGQMIRGRYMAAGKAISPVDRTWENAHEITGETGSIET